MVPLGDTTKDENEASGLLQNSRVVTEADYSGAVEPRTSMAGTL